MPEKEGVFYCLLQVSKSLLFKVCSFHLILIYFSLSYSFRSRLTGFLTCSSIHRHCPPLSSLFLLSAPSVEPRTHQQANRSAFSITVPSNVQSVACNLRVTFIAVLGPRKLTQGQLTPFTFNANGWPFHGLKQQRYCCASTGEFSDSTQTK